MLGFAKSERANVDDDELEDLRTQARVFLKLSVAQLEAAIAVNELMEVAYGGEDDEAAMPRKIGESVAAIYIPGLK